MQRHKMDQSFGKQGGQQGSQAEHRGESQPERPEDGFLEEEGTLFGHHAGKYPSTDSEQASDTAPADHATSAEIAEERFKAEIVEMRLRTAAEMENFKKRLTREHEEQMRYASEKVLGDLLPTLDNLDLALRYGSKHEACKDMLQGVAMTHKLLLDAVEKHGLKPLGEEGEEFDPNVHEAVGFEDRSDFAPNSVARVLQRGFKLGDRLIRPAKVMVKQ